MTTKFYSIMEKSIQIQINKFNSVINVFQMNKHSDIGSHSFIYSFKLVVIHFCHKAVDHLESVRGRLQVSRCFTDRRCVSDHCVFLLVISDLDQQRPDEMEQGPRSASSKYTHRAAATQPGSSGCVRPSHWGLNVCVSKTKAAP